MKRDESPDLAHRRSCLLCQAAGGWPVAVLIHGHWGKKWKVCHQCSPKICDDQHPQSFAEAEPDLALPPSQGNHACLARRK
jgi:hypothetical protein